MQRCHIDRKLSFGSLAMAQVFDIRDRSAAQGPLAARLAREI
jgi:hypothetical protein